MYFFQLQEALGSQLPASHLHWHEQVAPKPLLPAQLPVATCVSRSATDGIVRVSTIGLKSFLRSVAPTPVTRMLPTANSSIAPLHKLPLAPAFVTRLLQPRIENV